MAKDYRSGVVLQIHVFGMDGQQVLGLHGLVLRLVMIKGYRWGWCCMSMNLVWVGNKFLGYRGLVTVFVTREEVNMMVLSVLRVWLVMMNRGYRYLVYRGLVNVIVTREELNMMGLSVGATRGS